MNPGPDIEAQLLRLEPIPNMPAAEFLEHHAVLPMGVAEDGVATILTWKDSPDGQALDDLSIGLRADFRLVRAPDALASHAVATVRRLYGPATSTAKGLIDGLGGDPDEASPVADGNVALDDIVSAANEPPVVRLVNMFLVEALEARASDVHLEQYASGLRVRYRIDGVLRDVAAPPARLAAAICSRLKIMAQLDVAERRVPQDGRVRLKLSDRNVDVRLSTLPTLYGESIVLRLLDRDLGRVALADIGMPAETLDLFCRAIARPSGLVLVTGPTGSGKTTTLYAAIDRIRTGREKIVTVEDPVEYELEGVPQVAVNEKLGLTFARALRALLRQDPDVIFVGEIRDAETAAIATHAALTGHLVLSTMHSSDAIGAIARLIDLDVPAYLVASTLQCVVAQRLVRRLCTSCGGTPPTDTESCWMCQGEGLAGRTGVYEFVPVDTALRAAIHSGSDPDSLRRLAVDSGMRVLEDDLARLVANGVTTDAEAARFVA